VFADRRQHPVHVGVGAQNVRQDRGVAGVRFAAGLTESFAIPGHRARVDRVNGEPGVGEGDDEQVLVGFSMAIGVSSGVPPFSAINLRRSL
jgi:hypothetical protein